MKRRWRGGAALALVVAAGIQFIPVARTNPPVVADVQAPAPVKKILVGACYDCHSHETRWPWYSRVAPLSWWISSHVKDGRKGLDFSRWPTFDFDAQDLILHDIDKQISTGAMPPRSYALMHPEARLDAHARGVLLDWARSAGDEMLSGP